MNMISGPDESSKIPEIPELLTSFESFVIYYSENNLDTTFFKERREILRRF